MSLYKPRISMPGIPRPSLPKINFGNVKRPFMAVGAVILMIIILFVMFSFMEPQSIGFFLKPVGVEWKNNPLDLRLNENQEALMTLTLKNTSNSMTSLMLDLDTNSNEIIIFPTHEEFPNVSPGNYRVAKSIVKRNPSSEIFTGSYTITIKTNLGEQKTTLRVIVD